jgi:hypothetical protein
VSTPSAQTGTKNTTTSLITTTQPPYSAGISLNLVPKIGETTEMTYTFDVVASDFLQGNPGTENARAWVEFWWTDPTGSYLTAKQAVKIPLSEVVVSGDTTWQGDYTKTRSLHLTSTIKLPRAGIWQIEGYFTGAGWKTPIKFYSRDFINQDFAADMYSDSFKTSPFAYLGYDYFDYGFLKDKRKIDFLNAQFDPVIMELDIAKPPKAGEKVTLTCTMDSLSDVSDFSAAIHFYRRLPNGGRLEEIGSDFLPSGSLTWQGNLKQGIPVVFSVVIKFPEEGDWEILAEGNSQANINNHIGGYSDDLDITLSSVRNFFGWNPLIVKPGTSTPAFTPTAVPTN